MKTLYKFFLSTGFAAFLAVSVFAQAERESGAALYKKGDYAGAVKLLKQAAKIDANDAQAWYFLGLSYLKQDKNKEAEKALKKAVELDQTDTKMRVGLAYVYLLRNKSGEAQTEAQTALESNPNDEQAHYIVGAVNFRNGAFNAAYERAKQSIAINPNFAAAYLLKSQSMVGSFAAQTVTRDKPRSARGEMLREAAADMAKYLALTPNDKEARFYSETLESLRFFSEYYNRPENQKSFDLNAIALPVTNETPIKIISKPRASYTDRARDVQLQGTITVLVGFSAEARVEHIIVINSLGYGLDEEVVKAARAIKFEPATENGKPISTVKTVQYTFTIY